MHFTTRLGTFLEILDLNNSENLVQFCVNKILSHHYENNQIVVSLNVNFPVNYPIINLQFFEILDLFAFGRAKIYLIGVNLDSDLDETIQYLNEFRTFNPQAKFIIILDRLITDKIFKMAVKYYISHIVVLETHSLNLYTYYPYNNQNINNPDTTIIPLGSCLNNPPSLFTKTVPPLWGNSTVRIAYKPIPPYVVDPYSTLEGIEIFTLETISKYYNFQIEYFLHNGSYYNEKKPETYYLAFGGLLTHDIDITVGGFYLKNSEIYDFDVSYEYLQDSLFWVVPKARELQKWQRIIVAFSFDTWTAFLASFFLYNLIYVLHLHLSQLKVSTTIFFHLFSILIEQPTKIRVKYTVRALVLTWIFYCLIISTAFKSQIINLLSGVTYESDITTLQEIVDSELVISLPVGYANMYDHGDPLEKYIYDHNVPCPKTYDCLQRTATKRDTASIAMGRYIAYHSPYFLNEHGHSTIHVMSERVCVTPIHMIISKGFPMFEHINSLILLLQANGIIDYNYDYMDNIFKSAYFSQLRLSEKVELNDVETMALPFVLLLFGLFFSLFVLLLELIWSKLSQTGCLVCGPQ
ncbi:uncharacterized protein LOC123004083 [Tribolium madens]|uniref:uncharacterized protein LOC123004083 n=1 Tax=Tribolium madens TaxID=41895 RepID=UPI001CF7219D|nr:uncharacterized protein LOC123004083 [Tribolium madens]